MESYSRNLTYQAHQSAGKSRDDPAPTPRAAAPDGVAIFPALSARAAEPYPYATRRRAQPQGGRVSAKDAAYIWQPDRRAPPPCRISELRKIARFASAREASCATTSILRSRFPKRDVQFRVAEGIMRRYAVAFCRIRRGYPRQRSVWTDRGNWQMRGAAKLSRATLCMPLSVPQRMDSIECGCIQLKADGCHSHRSPQVIAFS